jgi:hypothetical protein
VTKLVWSRLPISVALLALAALTPCTSCVAPAERREESLMKIAREFNDGLRWGRDDQVYRCLSPADMHSLQARKADLGEDFVMADHEMKSIQIVPGVEKATVVAEFTWFNQRRAVVKKSTVEQKWEWHDGRWMVTEQTRIAGDRFPLVPEHLDAHRTSR